MVHDVDHQGEYVRVLRKWNDAEKKLKQIEIEVNTYHGRRMTVIDYRKTAHFTIELIDKILDGSYFKEKDDV